ncbi:MAG: methyltransferase domain-containing protein [Chloroflexi bacterium]|nr:methyltransferase domain-containing protein [Chloroflexota bacterium]
MSLRDLLRSIQRRVRQDGAYPHQLAFVLLLPLRRLFITPQQVADRLALPPNARVLELGPGPGYLSVEVARRIPQGYLLLADIQMEMLHQARRRLERARVEQVGYVQANALALPLAEGAFDAAFLVTVLGEVPEPRACLRELYRVLRPQGLLSITEQPIDPDHIPLSELRVMAEEAGLALEQVFGRGKNYTANLRKP